jgi:hypothetical protein
MCKVEQKLSAICRRNLQSSFGCEHNGFDCKAFFLNGKSKLLKHLSVRRGDPTHEWHLVCCDLLVGFAQFEHRKQR